LKGAVHHQISISQGAHPLPPQNPWGARFKKLMKRVRYEWEHFEV
jgi:hypothetical protein